VIFSINNLSLISTRLQDEGEGERLGSLKDYDQAFLETLNETILDTRRQAEEHDIAQEQNLKNFNQFRCVRDLKFD
jgi:hypothetical protein